MRSYVLLATLAVATLAAPVHAADVLVVDNGDPTAYQLPLDAVAAAQPGDVILVRAGTGPYVPPPDPDSGLRPTLVITRGLTLVGESGARPSIGLVRIQDLPADESVVVANALIEPLGNSFFDRQYGFGVEVLGCDGSVLLEDVEAYGPDLPSTLAGLAVSDSDQVTISRSSARGGTGTGDFATSTPGGPGLLVVDARVNALHSTFTGGLGGSLLFHPPGVPDGSAGGPGVRATDADLRLFGVTALGGTASSFCNSSCSSPGLWIEGASAVRAVGSSWIADGDGDDLLQTGGQLAIWDDTVPALSGPATVAAGAGGAITVRGAPGDVIGIFFALGPGFVPLGGKKGVFGVETPFSVPIVLGSLPGSGELVLPFAGADLQGLPSLPTIWQVYAAAPAAGFVLSNPHALTLLAD